MTVTGARRAIHDRLDGDALLCWQGMGEHDRNETVIRLQRGEIDVDGLQAELEDCYRAAEMGL